jgi:pimeloyl-ACP methyl ester carboxylesterase
MDRFITADNGGKGKDFMQNVDLMHEVIQNYVGPKKDFVVVSHSYGGLISIAYALKHPGYLKQLVPVDPFIQIPIPLNARVVKFPPFAAMLTIETVKDAMRGLDPDQYFKPIDNNGMVKALSGNIVIYAFWKTWRHIKGFIPQIREAVTKYNISGLFKQRGQVIPFLAFKNMVEGMDYVNRNIIYKDGNWWAGQTLKGVKLDLYSARAYNPVVISKDVEDFSLLAKRGGARSSMTVIGKEELSSIVDNCRLTRTCGDPDSVGHFLPMISSVQKKIISTLLQGY